MNDKVRSAGRVIFIDLARALAVVLMVSGHTSSALLDRSYRTTEWFGAWNFQRGLTSALFLLLSGFAFSVATSRHWTTHIQPTWAVFKRLRRFALFIVLGYGLHFPVGRFWHLPAATDAQWRAFLAVDVLQLIGVTFVFIQLLVIVVRSRGALTMAVLALAAGAVGFAPAVWGAAWESSMPLVLSSYLSSATGSQFPLFPWAGFVLLGAGIGQLYARWGASHLHAFANWGMLMPGALLVAIAMTMSQGVAGPSGLELRPADFVLRTGVCLALLGVIAHISGRVGTLPHVFGAVAQESLLVYFVHLCVVYGSVWNRGLYTRYGESLSLPLTALAAGGVILPMIALAWYWNGLKHHRPRVARWVSLAAGALLVGWLL